MNERKEKPFFELTKVMSDVTVWVAMQVQTCLETIPGPRLVNFGVGGARQAHTHTYTCAFVHLWHVKLGSCMHSQARMDCRHVLAAAVLNNS
jgi:hypothetical protein